MQDGMVAIFTVPLLFSFIKQVVSCRVCVCVCVCVCACVHVRVCGGRMCTCGGRVCDVCVSWGWGDGVCWCVAVLPCN